MFANPVSPTHADGLATGMIQTVASQQAEAHIGNGQRDDHLAPVCGVLPGFCETLETVHFGPGNVRQASASRLPNGPREDLRHRVRFDGLKTSTSRCNHERSADHQTQEVGDELMKLRCSQNRPANAALDQHFFAGEFGPVVREPSQVVDAYDADVNDMRDFVVMCGIDQIAHRRDISIGICCTRGGAVNHRIHAAEGGIQARLSEEIARNLPEVRGGVRISC